MAAPPPEQSETSETKFKKFLTSLESQPGVLKRVFLPNKTIVEQETKNTCFYRLTSGEIRFEKRILNEKNVIQRVTMLGKMDETAEWTFFCELSAFGIQEKTSAAIVAETEVAITIIPVESFFEFCKINPQFNVLFYESITKRLAQMLRGLHTRTLNISSVNVTISGQQIHNEAVIFSWPCSMKHGFGKTEGQLSLSHNYLAFLKKKNIDKKGVVSDASDSSSPIIELKAITELNFSGAKITIRSPAEKIVVSLKKTTSVSMVKDIISMSRTTNEKVEVTQFKKDESVKATGRLVICTSCKNYYCVYCRSLTGGKNPCRAGGSHEYSLMESVVVSPCARCKNEGTHILLPQDLKMLLEKFETASFAPGAVVQANESQVERIGYVLEGSVIVSVLLDGKTVKLNDVVAGETIGDIGAFLGSPSSAELLAGEKGCELLEIPLSFLFADSNHEFRIRIYMSLIQLMWHRIIRQEDRQISEFIKKMEKACDVSFLSESLLRGGAISKGIDSYGNSGWY